MHFVVTMKTRLSSLEANLPIDCKEAERVAALILYELIPAVAAGDYHEFTGALCALQISALSLSNGKIKTSWFIRYGVQL